MKIGNFLKSNRTTDRASINRILGMCDINRLVGSVFLPRATSKKSHLRKRSLSGDNTSLEKLPANTQVSPFERRKSRAIFRTKRVLQQLHFRCPQRRDRVCHQNAIKLTALIHSVRPTTEVSGDREGLCRK